MRYPVNRPVLVIVGPTASGKTNTAVSLALALNGEIISADSRYFYKGMDIGTAKPSFAEMKGIQHYLINIAEPNEVLSLGEYKNKVLSILGSIHDRHKLAILVGGSGQYIRSIIEGWKVPEVLPNEKMREILESWALEIGNDGLHAKLRLLDAKAADNIDFKNLRRTVRALEVIFHTGKEFSLQRITENKTQYNFKVIGLNCSRTLLYKKIDKRIDDMLEQGWISEVKNLRDTYGFSSSMSAIGYGEISAYLDGKHTLKEAVELIKKRTRKFVRRQANWFKSSDRRIKWFDITNLEIKNLIEYVQSTEGWF